MGPPPPPNSENSWLPISEPVPPFLPIARMRFSTPLLLLPLLALCAYASDDFAEFDDGAVGGTGSEMGSQEEFTEFGEEEESVEALSVETDDSFDFDDDEDDGEVESVAEEEAKDRD